MFLRKGKQMTRIEAIKKMYVYLMAQAASPSEVAEYTLGILSLVSPDLVSNLNKNAWKTLIINYCDLDPQKWINEYFDAKALFKHNPAPNDGDLKRDLFEGECRIMMYHSQINIWRECARGEMP